MMMLVLAIAVSTPLRVCADPNNLPFSNARGEGFENALAQQIAAALGTTVEYTWHAQRRGFVRETLKEKTCDVIIGTIAGVKGVRTTKPYYTSSYVFVARGATPVSFDDPKLAEQRVGVHVIGEDAAMLPPAQALARRGHITNVRGFSIYGDYTEESPPARLIDAVRTKQIDVAVAWGPLAGYYARKAKLTIGPVGTESDLDVPMTYAIAMGVRKDDDALLDALNHFIDSHRGDIDALLERYAVPRR